jgi:hypothetical protein
LRCEGFDPYEKEPLLSEVALAVGIQLSPETPEQRMERRAEQRGELIFVAKLPTGLPWSCL